jgi:hypothetical protein
MGSSTGARENRPSSSSPGSRRSLRLRSALQVAACALLALSIATPASAGPVFTLSLTLQNSAFDLPTGAPNAILHGGQRFAPGVPFDLVIFLHGYSGCINVLARTGRARCTPTSPVERGWGLAAAHDRAGTNTLFLMPQLAFRQRNGDPGRLRQDGYARDLVREAFRAAGANVGNVGLDRVRRIILVAHSGGFDAAGAILAHGRLGPRVKRVVLFDALYGNTSQFLDWVQGAPDRSLVSIYNAGRPAEQTRMLVAGARRTRLRVIEQPASLRNSIRRYNVTAFHTRVAHSDIPARFFRDVVQF